MFEYSKTTRCCATCANWGGARQTSVSKPSCSYVDSQAVHGKCYCSQAYQAHVSGAGPQSNYSCQYWEKWGALR